MTTMHCPRCDAIRQCYWKPPAGNQDRVYFDLPNLILNGFQRDRECVVCDHRRTTVELDKDGLMKLFAAWKILAEGADVVHR